MRATVTQAFRGLPDGDSTVKQFEPGDIVEGDLAEVAVREGWAKRGASGAKATDAAGKKSAAASPSGSGEVAEGEQDQVADQGEGQETDQGEGEELDAGEGATPKGAKRKGK